MHLAVLVDWTALGQVVAYSFVGALGLTVLFTAGVVLVESDDGTTAPPVARRAAGVVALAICLALLVFGLSVLFDK